VATHSVGGKAIHSHKWKWAAACALAAAAAVWLWSGQSPLRNFDWNLAAQSVAQVRWGWLAFALVPIAGTYYVRALRWVVFLKPLKAQPSVGNVFAATLIGFAAVTLFGRPGDLVRPYLIAVREGVSLPSQMSAWFLERIFDLLAILAIFGFALAHLHSKAAGVGPNLLWILGAGGKIVSVTSLILLFLLLSLRFFAVRVQEWLGRALRYLPERHFHRIEGLIGDLIAGIGSIRSGSALLAISLYSVAEWALITCCFWCTTRSFSGMINLSWVDVLVLMGFVAFGGVVQLPGIGGGMQVVSVLVLHQLFGVSVEMATSFAMLVWLITFVAVVPPGLVLALKTGLDWRGLRKIGRGVSK
jgi:uncharacterized protein (TIRG00374 family)